MSKMVKVLASPEAQAQILELPKVVKARMYRIIERLQRWPHVSGVKPLRGKLAGHYRIRTGDYRIQFRVEGEFLIIERVGHRDRFYDG